MATFNTSSAVPWVLTNSNSSNTIRLVTTSGNLALTITVGEHGLIHLNNSFTSSITSTTGYFTFDGASTGTFGVCSSGFSGFDMFTAFTTLDGLYYSTEHIERQMKKQRLKNNLLIKVNHRQRPLTSKSPAEEKARNTLRDMLTEADWRRYITNGFVMVKGLHYWYQIFRGSGVNVYHEGKKINNICIHTDDACPPTDHVINMISLIEYDEAAVWRFGNVKTPDGHLLVQARREKLLA
jgi:hypothetical protein